MDVWEAHEVHLIHSEQTKNLTRSEGLHLLKPIIRQDQGLNSKVFYF